MEDTDVGFPGPEHVIAEREPAMKIAMTLAGAASPMVGGFIQMPGVDDVITQLPQLGAGSHAARLGRGRAFDKRTPGSGLVIGAIIGLVGITLAYGIYVRRPGTAAKFQARAAVAAQVPGQQVVLRRD